MSVIRTFTVTVVSTGSGNKYFIDGVQQKTLNLIEGKTYEFDQSDSSNSSHPFRFSTTSNGTHSGGSEYTTGVTTNGTPRSAGAYTRITVASSAPTLYYYCTNHSGMGGQANTLDASIMRAYDVTVVSTDSGNKYVINGVQQDTVNLAEGATYYFDQSASSNSNHPLRFSTTSDGTHNSGSEYTTGVTTGGTPGSAGAYTQIAVAASAPTLYYYCTNHSGMGGQANTVEADSWGVLQWNQNTWGSQDAVVVSLTGVSATTSIGSVLTFLDAGWGGKSWGNNEWGELSDNTVLLTGQSATSSVGVPIAGALQGWGRAEWGEQAWGESNNPTVLLTGQSTISSVGSTSILTEINQGWGSDTWGTETWGQSGILVELTGLEMQSNTGEDVSWGKQTWGSSTTGWGGEYYLDVTSVMGLSGLSATSSVGAPTAISDVTLVPTGISATSTLGSVSFDFSIDVPLTGVSSTSSVGAIDPADQVMGLTGLSSLSSIGEVFVSGNPTIDIVGVSATATVGALTPADVMGLTGVSATAAVGALTPADVMGLTGVSATASVGNVAPLGYEAVTGTQSAGYNSVTATQSANYTAVND